MQELSPTGHWRWFVNAAFFLVCSGKEELGGFWPDYCIHAAWSSRKCWQHATSSRTNYWPHTNRFIIRIQNNQYGRKQHPQAKKTEVWVRVEKYNKLFYKASSIFRSVTNKIRCNLNVYLLIWDANILIKSLISCFWKDKIAPEGRGGAGLHELIAICHYWRNLVNCGHLQTDSELLVVLQSHTFVVDEWSRLASKQTSPSFY